MQDLATATGVQRGSLYNAYGDKEAIFLRAFDQYAGQFLETAGNALAQGDTAARLQSFVDVIIANMTSGSPPRGCLTTRNALDTAASSSRKLRRPSLMPWLSEREGDERARSDLGASAPGSLRSAPGHS